MKLFVAYVRPHMAQATVAGLLEAGCPDVLVHDGKRLVPGLRGEEYAHSIELGQRYEPMTILMFPAPRTRSPDGRRSSGERPDRPPW